MHKGKQKPLGIPNGFVHISYSNSKSSLLLQRHILKPVSILSFSRLPRSTNFSPHLRQRIRTFTRSLIIRSPHTGFLTIPSMDGVFNF